MSVYPDPLPPDYPALLAELKAKIGQARVRAALTVNRELTTLYWRIGRDILERDLERSLIEHLRALILELGKGFAFVGSRYHLEVGDQDFYLDLLFYHLRLRAFVVIELKVEDFRPESAEKMNFYFSAVDEQLRHPDDQPSIGIILCQGRNEVIVEYALRDTRKPMGVARYTPLLPGRAKDGVGTARSEEARQGSVSDVDVGALPDTPPDWAAIETLRDVAADFSAYPTTLSRLLGDPTPAGRTLGVIPLANDLCAGARTALGGMIAEDALTCLLERGTTLGLEPEMLLRVEGALLSGLANALYLERRLHGSDRVDQTRGIGPARSRGPCLHAFGNPGRDEQAALFETESGVEESQLGEVEPGVDMSDHLPIAGNRMRGAVFEDSDWYARTEALRQRRFAEWLEALGLEPCTGAID